MEYRTDDLTIIDDPITIIRRNPFLYGGEQPRSARLAAALARDLICHGDVPVSVEDVEGWWLITCQKDWLSDGDTDKSQYWSRMIPTPDVMRESIRSEILLTAFATGLLTMAGGKTQWILRDATMPTVLGSRIRRLAKSNFIGRAVAFTAD